MSPPAELTIAVLSGDGIGPEVMRPCLALLDVVAARLGGFRLRFEELEAGAGLYRRCGESLPAETLARAGRADAILLGAMGLPEVRRADGTEIAPQLDLRERFELFAGVRPVKTLAGLPLPLRDPRASRLDFVIVRESTEGLFAGRHASVAGPDRVEDTLRVTRTACERLFEFAFRLAARRKQRGAPGLLTCVDKANVLPSLAFFRRLFDDVAKHFPEVATEHCYVDAAGLGFVKRPWSFDVLVTENMFGDILSDVGAGLMGGMGFAPSADIGERHAVFQPCHGSAPDIAGRGIANPTATVLSGAMMLEWLGQSRGLPACERAGRALTAAVERAFADGRTLPVELGGQAGTEAIHERIGTALEGLDPEPAAAVTPRLSPDEA